MINGRIRMGSAIFKPSKFTQSVVSLHSSQRPSILAQTKGLSKKPEGHYSLQNLYTFSENNMVFRF